MFEPRPLPMGMAEFEEWADRIISGALITADADSQKFALANMLMQLGPTEHHKPDIHFISSLRKIAVNQIADAVRKDIHAKIKEKTAAEEAEKKAAEDEIKAKLDAEIEQTKQRMGTT